MKKLQKSILACLFLLSITSLNAQNFNEIIKAVASDRAAMDNFGTSVSISGDYAIITAPGDGESATGVNSMIYAGSAYIFERNSSGMWIEVQKIVTSDRAVDDQFGASASISGDYAVVSTIFEDEDATGGNTMNSAGSAYIFERNSLGVWHEVQKIVASDRAADDNFGFSVSISGDYVIVGARLADIDVTGGNNMSAAGSAYLFERNNSGVWNEVQKIVASDRDTDDWFGTSVSISGDYAIVGAYQEDNDPTGGNTINYAGSAYLFERNGSGIWSEAQKIVASDRAFGDRFGMEVSISGDYLIVGTPRKQEPPIGGITMNAAGAAYIFERTSAGIWNEVQKIIASDRTAGDYFGSSVSISGDYAIVGASTEDEDATGGNTLITAGSAYVFVRNGSGVWNEVQKIVASDRAASDQFSWSASISGDYAIVGTPRKQEPPIGGNSMNYTGSAYVFETINTVGVIENDFGGELMFFPNPSDGNFSIDLGAIYESAKISIYDVNGQIIRSEAFGQEQFFNMSIKEPNGLYLITIIAGDKRANIKLIKN